MWDLCSYISGNDKEDIRGIAVPDYQAADVSIPPFNLIPRLGHGYPYPYPYPGKPQVAVVNVIGQGQCVTMTRESDPSSKTQLQQHLKFRQIGLKANTHFNNWMRLLRPTGSSP